jgi:tetratricopeptide (TPR) repeat protein
MSQLKNYNNEQEFTFKNFFIPITAGKAIFWIIVVGLFVFGNGMFNGFVGDDDLQVVNNLFVHSIGNAVTFFTGSTFYNGGTQQAAGVYYKPVLSVYYSLIYTFFGPNNFAFHFFQLMLHITNAGILFLIFKRFLKKSISFFLALIFLIHPINSEAVYYVSAAQDTLFFFFGVLALYFLDKINSRKKYIFVVIFLFLSLFSKETGVAFLFISVLYSFFFKRKYLVRLLISSSLTFACYILLRVHAIGFLSKATNAPICLLNFTERLINIPAIFAFYVKQFILPVNLSSSYQWIIKQVSFNSFFVPLIVDIMVISILFGILLIQYKKKLGNELKAYAFFLCWFLIGMVIHLQLFSLDATAAERWFYFPIAGLLGMIGMGFGTLKVRINEKLAIIMISIIILLLSTRTFIRSFNWRDDFSLVSHDIKVSKDAYDLENGMGYQLFQQGKIKEAKIHAERSVALFPYLTNYNSLGLMYLSLGEYENAKKSYEKALKFGDYYLTYENLAGLAVVYGDPDENIKFILNALGKFYQDATLWKLLAIIEYRSGKIDFAKTAIRKAYQYDNQDQNIGIIYNTIMNNQPLRLNYTIGK